MVIPIKLKDHSENSVTAVTAFHKSKLNFVLLILSTLEYYSLRAKETY